MNIIVRPYQPNDDALIYSTWTKNRWYSCGRREKPQPNKAQWFRDMIDMIKDIIGTGSVLIACSSEDPNLIAGYIASKDRKPVWIYVKENYRKQGIGTLLKKKVEE